MKIRKREKLRTVAKSQKEKNSKVINSKGITLISLVITIIVMLILTGIAINLIFGENGILTKAKLAKQVYLGDEAKREVEDKVNVYITKYGPNRELSLYDFWAMYNSKKIINAEGKETTEDNPDYDPDFFIYLFEEEQAAFPSIQTGYAKTTQYKSAIVVYKGSAVTVDSKLKVTEKVKAVADLTEEEKQKFENEGAGGWNDAKGVEAPVLSQGMVPVMWKDSNWVICSSEDSEDSEWYNYVNTSIDNDKSGNIDTNESKWANVMLMDGLTVYDNGTTTTVTNENLSGLTGKVVKDMGSMFVWIPRYEYKIDSSSKKIDVKFISKGTTYKDSNNDGIMESDDGFIIHPAFTNDTANGGWNSELPGIWVAKFEASKNSNNVKVVPNVSSWRKISIGSMYTYCRNMTGINAGDYGFVADTDTIVDEENQKKGEGKTYAHLMKNSEWGAVAYLTHSKYGRNGTEVSNNPNSNCVTGQAGKSVTTSSTTSTKEYNDTNYGVKASTTGNVYGIYDMNGGAWEYVAAYNNTGNLSNGSIFATESEDTNKSTKYATWYANGSSSSFTSVGCKVGDATYETAGWFSDNSNCAYDSYPFFKRGGSYDNGENAGVFASYYSDGSDVSKSGFRPVLVVQ